MKQTAKKQTAKQGLIKLLPLLRRSASNG
ncbi:hypothetical protein JOD47_001964 [Arthrobacter tumbae]|nr:hypothetical protein [Arthrobacter tumbae]